GEALRTDREANKARRRHNKARRRKNNPCRSGKKAGSGGPGEAEVFGPVDLRAVRDAWVWVRVAGAVPTWAACLLLSMRCSSPPSLFACRVLHSDMGRPQPMLTTGASILPAAVPRQGSTTAT